MQLSSSMQYLWHTSLAGFIINKMQTSNNEIIQKLEKLMVKNGCQSSLLKKVAASLHDLLKYLYTTAVMHDATVLSHMVCLMHSIESLSHTEPYWAILKPLTQHWAILTLIINALMHWAEQCTFELGAHNVIVNNAHAQAVQYGVDSGQQMITLLYISRERKHLGANRLSCIGLNPTRITYFGSDGCQKRLPSVAPCTDLYTSLASSNFSFFLLLCL